MTRIFLMTVLLGGLFYLYRAKHRPPPPPPPPAIKIDAPTLDEAELASIRQATRDSEPGVRWAAAELLYTLRDPKAKEILQQMMSYDLDPAIRRQAVSLMRAQSAVTAPELISALNDTEKEIRIAALQALADKDDARIIPYIAEKLTDTEPAVRLQALNSLRAVQERKRAQYEQLRAKLKRDYEESVRKSRG